MTGPADSPLETTSTPASVSIEVLRGTPSDEELAALIAVVSDAYATEAAHAVVDDAPARSAWYVSARALREPMRRELGWRHG